jgi:hypothetical protein
MNDNLTYGNHSCCDCKENHWCPISDKSTIPNGCSFYNPPIAKWTMPIQMRAMLMQIKAERIAMGKNPRIHTDD